MTRPRLRAGTSSAGGHHAFGCEGQHRYIKCKKKTSFCLHRYFQEGTVMTNYADVLAILVRLRQFCCHPNLVGKYTVGGM